MAFSYDVSDGHGGVVSRTGWITIEASDPPVVVHTNPLSIIIQPMPEHWCRLLRT